MKFTEGYWLCSESVNATYASQAFKVEALPGRLRIVAPGRIITDRGGALDCPTITTEFASFNENTIGVRSWHFQGYDDNEPRFALMPNPAPVHIEDGEDEAVMTAGNMTVRVNKKEWGFRFEAGGRVLTQCCFRNLGYMRRDRPRSTMLPADNYLADDGAKPYMMTELSLAPGECVYGLGERFTAFVKNGQAVDMWNEDGGTSSHFAYKNIPLYLTNRGYGVFVDHCTPVSFEVASEKVEYVGFSVPGEELRYHVIYGETPKAILQSYTAVTGRPTLPPAWSFGLWLSTSFTTEYDEKTTTSFIDGMRQRDIPLSVFHYDCYWMQAFHWTDFVWDGDTFPDPVGMLRRQKEKGLHTCVWINPYIAQGTATFAEGLENGYFLQRADGKGPKQLDRWQPGMALVDFTNPNACEWYAAKLRGLLAMGVDSFKTDFGERIPIDVRYHNGANPVAMHNFYTYLYNKCVYDTLLEARGEGEAVVFARSATAGCQQFPVHWGGDNSASYPSMAETLRGGLSFAMSGFAFWSHDIGGFEATAPADLYKRWVQFGMLSTHSRLHGSKSYRVPWSFDDEASDVLRFFAVLKNKLMPYLYAKAVEATETGSPVMRPMAMEFAADKAVEYLDMQYMLGDALLVAPIFNDTGKADYYLPTGTWTHLLSGEVQQGPGWFTGWYDYFSLPLFVRQNTLLPMGADGARPDYDYTKCLQLHLYALQDGARANCAVVDTAGSKAATITVRRAGDTVIVILDHPMEGAQLKLHGMGGPATVALSGTELEIQLY